MPAVYNISIFIEIHIVKRCEAWDKEGCQANRFSHVKIDESYRKFYSISNILLKILFHSATVNKCMLGMETFKNTFLLSVISVHRKKQTKKNQTNPLFQQFLSPIWTANQSPMKLTGIKERHLWWCRFLHFCSILQDKLQTKVKTLM